MGQQFCEMCGAPLPPNAAFCEACGQRVASAPAAAPASSAGGYCEQCGAKLMVGQVACPICGAPTANADIGSVGGNAGYVSSTGYTGGGAHSVTQPEKKPGFFKRLFGRKPKGNANTGGYSASPDERPCPQCGATVRSWQRSCPVCGYVLDAIGNTGAGPGGVNPIPSPAGYPSADDVGTSVLDENEADDAGTSVLSSEDTARVVRLSTGESISISLPATLGKGSQATCLITGNKAISRTHVRITVDGSGYQVEDLASTNGTKVDGVKLPKGGTAKLEEGTVFELGDEKFEFHIM